MSEIIIAYHVLYCSYTKVNATSVSVILLISIAFAKPVVFGLHAIYFVFCNTCNDDEL